MKPGPCDGAFSVLWADLQFMGVGSTCHMFKIYAAEGPLGGAPTPLGLAFARAAAKKKSNFPN